MYDSPFIITEPVGNNALSFNERPEPQKLYVPSLITGDLSDVQIGDDVVFEDFDEHGELKSCVGLKNLVRTTHPKTNVPVIIVDNHNHVFYFWFEARQKGLLKNGATLVHIDQHRDTRVPEVMLKKEDAHDLEKVFNYTNFTLNVGNYITPAMQAGLVGDLISITSEMALKEHTPQKYPSLIVNIDLDFWAKEMDYIDQNFSITQTQKWMQHADLITIATSPFFIEQKRAIGILNKLFM